jgi:hypothetical protein
MPSIHDLMLAVYRGQVAERIPLGIYERYLPRGDVERAVRQLGVGLIAYHPVVTMPGPAWHLYPGYVSEIAEAEFRVDHRWDREARVERRQFTTPVGSVWQEMAYDDGGVGSEHIRKHYITQREDYRVVQYLVEHSVLRPNEAAIRARIRDLGGDGILFGRLDRSPYQKCLIELAGAERFLIDLATDPEPAEELLEALYCKQEQSWLLALESPVEVLWQPDNVTAMMTPPAAFRKYCVPMYRQRAEQARAAGKPFVVHMDGQLRVLAPDLRDAAIDAVESFSLPDIGGDLTLREAQAALGQTVIVPNVPANWAGKPEREVIRRLAAMLDDALPDRPLMLEISEDIPMSQWRTFVPAVVRGLAT